MSALSDARLPRLLHHLGLALVLLLPWCLLHARAAAELSIDGVAALFVLRCAVERRWAWLGQAWVVVGLLWWAWLVACTVLNGTGEAILQAAASLRFLAFVAALEHGLLAGPRARVWLWWSLGAATAYVAFQTLLQFTSGTNLAGVPRSEDGELTGPFSKPRAAPTYVRMLFPVLLPPASVLLARGSMRGVLASVGLAVGALAVLVLIGQRMPVLLAGIGLLVVAALLPRLRGPVLVAVVASGVLIATSAAVSPPTFYRLVTKFSRQMGDFADSPYGLIAERAVAIVEQRPVVGLGYDGFRLGCQQPRYFQGWHWPGRAAGTDGGGGTACYIHPHNLYLQAAVEGGMPGLVLFSVLVGLWLSRLGRGLSREPDPLRVGLFVAVLIQLWPIASTSPLVSLPIGGWLFLLLGFGLAEADARVVRPPRAS